MCRQLWDSLRLVVRQCFIIILALNVGIISQTFTLLNAHLLYSGPESSLTTSYLFFAVSLHCDSMGCTSAQLRLNAANKIPP